MTELNWNLILYLKIWLSHIHINNINISSVQSLRMWETCVSPIVWEDPLEKEMATHPLQYSGLENSMDCIVHGVAKSQTQLSIFHFLTSVHDYWKTIALTMWIFVNKVMPLLFNMLSRLVIAFLPKSKCLLIYWLKSLTAVISEPPKRKSATVSMKWWDWMPDLSFLNVEL